MKILVNTSNLVIGGGIQVGVWFIRQCLEQGLDCDFALSPAVKEELEKMAVECHGERFRLFAHSPSKNSEVRKRILAYEEEVQPDVVYTVFGPAYVKFKQPHACGFADGWVSHSDLGVFRRVFATNLLSGVKLVLTSIYKAFWMRFANAWIFEAKVAADGLAKRAFINRQNCHVIANNCSDRFLDTPVIPMPETDVFSLLYLTADYPHKGLANYLHYAKALKQQAPEQAFRFVITVSPSSPSASKIMAKAKEWGLEDYFDFRGHVSIDKVVEVMDQNNCVMQTSYLETFSANYPEAMARQRPLLVSDFEFARNICQDAAVYVDPDDFEQVAKAIIGLKQDKQLQQKLVRKGTQVLNTLPNSQQRFSQYIQLLESIA